jgi:HSP20 family protein
MARLRNPFEWFRREFPPLFGRAFPARLIPFELPWETPRGLEMEEKENEYVVRAEVPGFEARELEVNLTGNMLTIRAEHGKGTEAAAEGPYARLERIVTLPMGVNPEAVEARYHNGVLEVHLPWTAERLPRRVEVKT